MNPQFTLITSLRIVLSCLALCAGKLYAQSKPTVDASILQSGDLIWTRGKDTPIPYSSATTNVVAEWEAGKKAFISALLARKATWSPNDAQQYTDLQGISYEDFDAFYFAGRKAAKMESYGSTTGVVGHVALILVEKDNAFILEANTDGGVKQVEILTWLRSRGDNLFWVGRIQNLSIEKRREIAIYAKQFIGQPYDFWNFDLSSTNGFYCSKYVWYCTWKCTGIALDKNDEPRRTFWLSPKQLTKSTYITFLVRPANY